MLRKPKLTTPRKPLEDLCGELLRAVKVSEEEIAATAAPADLAHQYECLRLKIAEGGTSTGRASLYGRWLSFYAGLETPRFVVLTAAAAILMLLAASMFALLPGPSSPAEQSAETQPVAPTSPPQPQRASQAADPGAIQTASYRPRRISHRHKRIESSSTEVATDFLPLTFVDDSGAQESGHIVRVKVARSALIAFGVPMNMERAGELITADVVIGNDGLARAIRFVQ